MRASRRRFLAGAGGIVLGLPWLEKFDGRAYAQSSGTGPRRLIIMAYPMGVPVGRFRPSATGSNFTLPFVSAPLEPFKARSLFVTNLDNAVLNLNQQHSFGHPGKKEGALTGTLLTGAFQGDGTNRRANVIRDRAGTDTGGPNNESVCNFIGSRIRTAAHRRPSVDVAVNGETRQTENAIDSSFFFEGRANPVTMQANPARAFYEMFNPLMGQGGGQVDQALLDLRVRNKSVLDAVRGEFNELKTGLGRQDRTRLEEHAAKIRQIEIDLPNPTTTCTFPTGVAGNTGSAQAPYTPFLGMSMAQMAPMQLDILAQSMACDLAPVGRIEFINQQNPYFGVASTDNMQREWQRLAPGNGWHAMVHGDVFPGNNRPTRPNAQSNEWAQPLLDGYRFFAEQYAGLLSRLDAIPEGPEGSVLDHSLVMLVTDFGNGDGHNSNKMTYVLSGNTGPARIGYHVDDAPEVNFYLPGPHNVNQLLVSIIRMFGLTNNGAPINSFGLEGFSTGVLPALFA